MGPALILVIIAIPSLTLLYRLDSSFQSSLTLKTLGHQWYWSYEYSDFWSKNFSKSSLSRIIMFDSFMLPENENLSTVGLRLLETDNRVVIPYLTNIRIIVSRADVLHS